MKHDTTRSRRRGRRIDVSPSRWRSRSPRRTRCRRAQDGRRRRPLTVEDYTKWRSISGQEISGDGQWVDLRAVAYQHRADRDQAGAAPGAPRDRPGRRSAERDRRHVLVRLEVDRLRRSIRAADAAGAAAAARQAAATPPGDNPPPADPAVPRRRAGAAGDAAADAVPRHRRRPLRRRRRRPPATAPPLPAAPAPRQPRHGRARRQRGAARNSRRASSFATSRPAR